MEQVELFQPENIAATRKLCPGDNGDNGDCGYYATAKDPDGLCRVHRSIADGKWVGLDSEVTAPPTPLDLGEAEG